jgi:ABC-2 type transport system ATP-binding protein
VHEPQILVVDEPTVGLDPEERIRFRQLMTDLGRDRTILLSTHIVADLGGACREIALLDGGQIIFQGPPAELLAAAAGHVFEVSVDLPTAEKIEIEYEVVSRTSANNRITLRGVAANNQLPASASAVESPTLEESYIAFMATRGRSSVTRQDDEHESEGDL